MVILNHTFHTLLKQRVVVLVVVQCLVLKNQWSIRDVLKLQTAKDNNLNYLVFYNQQEVDTWLNDFLK